MHVQRVIADICSQITIIIAACYCEYVYNNIEHHWTGLAAHYNVVHVYYVGIPTRHIVLQLAHGVASTSVLPTLWHLVGIHFNGNPFNI